MINFICSADWGEGSPDSWKTSLGMSVRVFPEKISFELVNSIKQMALPSGGGHHESLECLSRTKRQRKGEFCIFLSWNTHLFHPQT